MELDQRVIQETQVLRELRVKKVPQEVTEPLDQLDLKEIPVLLDQPVLRGQLDPAVVDWPLKDLKTER